MADGQVLIDSKLDVGGIDKGIAELRQEFNRLSKEVSKVAKEIESGLKDIDVDNVADGMSESFESEGEQIEQAVEQAADSVEKSAEQMADAMEDSAEEQSDSMKKAWDKTEDEAQTGSRKVQDDIDDIGEEAKQTGQEIESGFKKAFKDIKKGFGDVAKDIKNGLGNLLNADFAVHFASNILANAFEIATEFAVDAVKQSVEAAAEIAAANAMFEQTFKGVEKTARDALQTISNETGVTASRMQTAFAKIFAFTKAVGGDTEQSMDIAARATRLAADNAAYLDTTIEDATETIYSFIKGNYENDAALNLVANEMARNAAANERYGKSFQELNGLQQADTLLSMAEAANVLSGAYGQASREADSWANVTGELSEAWKKFTAIMGDSAIETLTPVIQGITNALNEYLALRREFEEKKNPVAEEFNEIEEAAPPVADSIDKIAEAYTKAKEAARDSIDSQIGYFQEISLESDTSSQKIVENWKKQQEAFTSYSANIQKAVDMGLDEILIQQLSNGTTESMILLDALVNDSTLSVTEINAAFAGLNQSRDITAGVIAGIQEDLTVVTGQVGETVTQMTAQVSSATTNALTDASNSIQTTVFVPLEESASATGEAVGEAFDDAANTMRTAWADMGPWFDANVATPIKTSMEGVSATMSSKWSEMQAATSSAWASMVATIQSSVQQIQSSINSITGKTVYVNVVKTGSGASMISASAGYDGLAYTPATYDITPQIPYLATGAVIPPRAPFMAMLGDQMNGRNLEAPEELIRKIVREESGGAIDVRTEVTFAGTLAQFVRMLFPEIKSEARRRGNSLAKEVIE